MAEHRTFHDWRPIRNAIEAAYRELGQPVPSDIPTADWNLVGVAIEQFERAARPACIECQRSLDRYEVIRCLDCKAPLCERCAPKHFWPNGRPAA